jgi:ABC-type Fe3+-hydroxamate transport system substrate-binding protein
MGRLLTVALVLIVAVAGCGGADKTLDPLLNSVDKAHGAQALSALQQAQVAASLVKTESGGTYGTNAEDLAQKLQAKDPSKRFSTAPSAAPEQIQVLGGGGGAALLVAQGAPNVYVAIWDDGNGNPMYFMGKQPPPFSAQKPSGGGWSDRPLS